CRYILVPASLFFVAFFKYHNGSKMGVEKQAPAVSAKTVNRSHVLLPKNLQDIRIYVFVNNKPSVLNESQTDKFWSTPAAHAFCAQNGASKILFIRRRMSLELDEP
ncbi:MAG: hypothetical protein IJS86_00435, partial [Lachnospiraceae bacterium]|nr:hypothetical protein [Lachnospiraceae bacterium]